MGLLIKIYEKKIENLEDKLKKLASGCSGYGGWPIYSSREDSEKATKYTQKIKKYEYKIEQYKYQIYRKKQNSNNQIPMHY